MKTISQQTGWLLLLLLCTATAFAQPAKTTKRAAIPAQKTMKTTIDTVSYAFGMSVGRNLKEAKVDNLNPDIFLQAVKDVLDGKPTRVEHPAADAIIRNYFETRQAAILHENKEAGRKFLATNKTLPGVVELPGGLQYKMITEGAGATPAAEDTVKVHYKGTLVDGREFDSSYKRNEPTTFPLNGVIKGWSEGLQQAKEGAKIMLYIPSELAYGDHPMPGSIITPGATLIFEVELLEVRKAVPAATETPAAE